MMTNIQARGDYSCRNDRQQISGMGGPPTNSVGAGCIINNKVTYFCIIIKDFFVEEVLVGNRRNDCGRDPNEPRHNFACEVSKKRFSKDCLGSVAYLVRYVEEGMPTNTVSRLLQRRHITLS